jgi:hypothetical protein
VKAEETRKIEEERLAQEVLKQAINSREELCEEIKRADERIQELAIEVSKAEKKRERTGVSSARIECG